MAQLKKNAIGQLLFPVVDSTDFATIKSALTNAPTAKFFGVNHGVSTAATSGSISKAISHVHSGIYRMTLKAAETNYDYVLYRVIQASCADQLLTFQPLDNDDSDILSALTVIQSMASDAASAAQQANSRVLVVQSQASDAYSAIIAPLASMTSDVASAVWAHTIGTRVDSRILVAQSFLSDIRSNVSDLQSDFQSRVPKRVATDSQLSDLQSDLRSFLVVMSGVLSDAYSAISDMQSDFQSRVPKRVATDSQLSDLASDLRSYLVGMSDMLSNVQSELSDTHSDLASKIAGITATVSVSDISDIASAVWANTIGARVDSRVLVIKSQASDVYSLVAAGVPLDASNMSDLRSAIAAGPAATITASDISDIASAVWANTIGARVDSRILVAQSFLSDIRSNVSDLQSDFQSRVPKRVATDSQLSDLHSDLRSYLVVMSGVLSDAYSALSDFQSDFQSRVPKRVATDSQLSDLMSDAVSDLKSFIGVGVPADASTMSDLRSAIAATELDASDLSDIASAVRTVVSSDLSDIISAVAVTNSRVLLNQSRISDVYSMLSDVQSDFQSRVPKAVATNSQLSDLASDLKSYLAGNSGILSDIYSLLGAGVPADASTMSDLRSAITANGMLAAGADPTAVIGVTASYGAKLDWLAAMSRNKLGQTSTKQTLYRDDTTTVTASAVVADDGATASRGEFS